MIFKIRKEQIESQDTSMSMGDLIQNTLDNDIHPLLLRTTGVDMDVFQEKVYENVPNLTFANGIFFLALTSLVWLGITFILKSALVP